MFDDGSDDDNYFGDDFNEDDHFNEDNHFNEDDNEPDYPGDYPGDYKGGDSPQEYKTSIHAWERTGGGNILGDQNLREVTDPTERFKIRVNAMSKSLNDEELFVIGEPDIRTMLEKADQLQNVKYKNPMGYILGYLSTLGGKNFNTKIIKSIFKKLNDQKFKNSGIMKPDVIRYARLWLQELK